MIFWVVGRFNEFLHRNIGRWNIGVAETKVDHIVTLATRRNFQIVDDGEHIRRQAADASKIHGLILNTELR